MANDKLPPGGNPKPQYAGPMPGTVTIDGLSVDERGGTIDVVYPLPAAPSNTFRLVIPADVHVGPYVT